MSQPSAMKARPANANAASPKAPRLPLQVRWPRAEVRAAKIAAAEREQTVSDFMLACFHAYMQQTGIHRP
jgi:hypothetical protein